MRDAGVCASTQENMLSVGTASLPLLCKTDNKRYKGTVVVTNKVPSGSFRGYGYMESSALVNRAIMRACIGLGLDPVVYYEKNVLRHGERYYNALNQKEPWQYNASPDWKDTIHAAARDSDGRIVSRDGAFPAELTKAGGTAWAWDCQDTRISAWPPIPM